MKRIVFVWNSYPTPKNMMEWWDGLRAAIDKLREFYEISIFTAANVEDIESVNPDAILVWGSIDSPLCSIIKSYGKPCAFLYAGGPKDHPNFNNFDHIFYESEVDGEQFKQRGHSTSRAFGTNTELFTIQKQPKIFDAIFPATFARWKRHSLFANALKGKRAIACGNWQDVEEECRTVCTDNDILVTKAVHPEVLSSLYNASKCTVITSDENGGSQRAVLESLACGTPVIIMSDNKKCLDFGRFSELPEKYRYDIGTTGLHVIEPKVESIIEKLKVINTTRQEVYRKFVLDNYSETIYRNQLKKWLDKL